MVYFFVYAKPKGLGVSLKQAVDFALWVVRPSINSEKDYSFARLLHHYWAHRPSKVSPIKIPKQKPIVDAGLIVVLDDIRDPGNLGTIMRLCDWFGVEQLVCSPKTVDIYNPKVIQATMGSISRVAIHYTELKPFLANSKLSIFGTFMDGNNIYAEKLPASGIIIMGNEANGISEAVENLAKNRIAIPRFGKLKQTESLNVATATAIILSEFRRNA